jgi:hypothetical protein
MVYGLMTHAHRRHAHTMDNDQYSCFDQNPSGAQVIRAATDSVFALLFYTHNTDGGGVA